MENTALKETDSSNESNQEDVLVVVSKLKNYVRATSSMNTSGGVAATLSNLVKGLCDKAIENAKKEGRKTVMERDFTAASSTEATSEETLVVVSKLKNYVRASSGMNTSGGVAATLSSLVKGLCNQAIECAKKDGRKTLMDRDFSAVSCSTTDESCTTACSN